MRLGLFMMPLHRLRCDLTRALEDDLAMVEEADRLGFDEVWVGEHYTATTEPVTSPLMFLARAIDRAPRLTFGAGVLNLPQWHPVRAAGDAALFDHLCRGRFILGIGPGGLPSDMEVFGNEPPESRGERMLEALDMMLALWAGEPPYRLEGRYNRVVLERTVDGELGIGHLIRPYQRPHPPLAVSAIAPRSFMVRTAAERGWGAISAPFVPAANLAGHWRTWREGQAAAGRPVDGGPWRAGRTVAVADSEAEARDLAFDPEGGIHFMYDYLTRQFRKSGGLAPFKADPSVPDEAFDAERAIRERVVWGTPASVVDQLLALRAEVGPFGTLVLSAHDRGMSAPERRSRRLVAEEVMPRLRRAISPS